MLDFLSQNIVPIAILTAMELVLGADNLIFISILSSLLPANQQKLAQKLGLVLAIIPRLALLFFLGYLTSLEKPWLNILSHNFSTKDLILMAGGLFLLYKSVVEIHNQVYNRDHHVTQKVTSFAKVVTSIVIMNLVFSIDSVVTAVGMVTNVSVMIISVVISLGIMALMVDKLSAFILNNPSLKMLAMSFLTLIGGTLFFEATGSEINKNFIYGMMAFSFFVEMLNMADRHKDHQVTK